MAPLPALLRIYYLTLLLTSGALLAACSGASDPEHSWELALKGTYSAVISDNAEFALIGSITNGASLWRLQDKERLYDWNHKANITTNVTACAFSPEGNYAFTADTQTMVLWDNRSGKALRYWSAPSEILSVALTPDANLALLGLIDHSAVLFDVKRGGIKQRLQHKNRVRSVDLSEDGKLALTGSEDDTTKLWDVMSGKLLFTWQHNDEVRLVALSPKGDKAFSVSKYDRAALWNTENGQSIGELPLRSFALQRGQTFTAAQFSADSRYLLTGSADRLVQLWDTQTLKEVKRWMLPKRDTMKPTSAAVVALAFAEGSKRMYAVASNGFLHLLTR